MSTRWYLQNDLLNVISSTVQVSRLSLFVFAYRTTDVAASIFCIKSTLTGATWPNSPPFCACRIYVWCVRGFWHFDCDVREQQRKWITIVSASVFGGCDATWWSMSRRSLSSQLRSVRKRRLTLNRTIFGESFLKLNQVIILYSIWSCHSSLPQSSFF